MPDFKRIFESIPGLYLVLQPDLTIIAASQDYLKATMTRIEDIRGKYLFDVFPDNPDDTEATGVHNLSASLKRVMATGTPDAMAVQKYDVRRPADEGGEFEERFWSPLNSPVTNETGNVEYIVHRVEDVTDFIRLKQNNSAREKLNEELKVRGESMESEIFLRARQLQEANSQLRDAQEELSKALTREHDLNELKSRFISNASHEFRTPLTSIVTSITLASKYTQLGEPARVGKHLDKALTSVSHLTDILDDILSVSKLEEGKIMAKPERFSLPVVFADIIAEMQRIAKSGQAIVYDHHGPDNVFLDRKIMRNILVNLVTNAVKFSPENSVITVASAIGDELTVTVTDKGIGIPPEDHASIFDRFFRANNAINIQGTGLGLSIVAKYIEMLGGSIGFDSTQEKGTTFIIKLPLKKMGKN